MSIKSEVPFSKKAIKVHLNWNSKMRMRNRVKNVMINETICKIFFDNFLLYFNITKIQISWQMESHMYFTKIKKGSLKSYFIRKASFSNLQAMTLPLPLELCFFFFPLILYGASIFFHFFISIFPQFHVPVPNSCRWEFFSLFPSSWDPEILKYF